MASVVKVTSEGTSTELIPAPFVGISLVQSADKVDFTASTYNITLNGFVVDTSGQGGDAAETESGTAETSRLNSLLDQQIAIENLFHGKKWVVLEIGSAKFQCRLTDLSFGEGLYINHAPYTINLFAYKRGEQVEACGTGLIESYGEEYSIEQDNSYGESVKYYTVTRSVSAVGRENSGVTDPTTGDPPGLCQAWQNAKKHLTDAGHDATSASAYPDGGLTGGLLELGTTSEEGAEAASNYSSYKHRRSQTIDVAAGSFSISDTWLIGPSGNKHHESFSTSVSSSTDGFANVSIDGTIRGFDTSDTDSESSASTGSNADTNARTEWLRLSNDGNFGVSCDLYKRVNASSEHGMNSQPQSVSVGINPDSGEITYSLRFDSRPSNIFDGVLTESITINDTYPGDVFSVIPIIGRSTGPILQGMGTRTEFTRSLSIEFVVDSSRLGYGDTRSDLLLTKPSLVAPFATEISRLVNDLSPSQESNVRKYFVNAPQETWNPKTGAYSLNVSWTYELSS